MCTIFWCDINGASRYVKAACGLNHTMVLTSSTKGCNLLAWGRGSYGQLGFGTGLPKMPQVTPGP